MVVLYLRRVSQMKGKRIVQARARLNRIGRQRPYREAIAAEEAAAAKVTAKKEKPAVVPRKGETKKDG